MVDVSACAGNASVVKHDDVRESGEGCGKLPLPKRAFRPGAGRLGFVHEREKDASEAPAEPLLDPSLTVRRSAIMLALGRGAGGAWVDRPWVWVRFHSYLKSQRRGVARALDPRIIRGSGRA
jgi:hypothetical protein